MDRMIFLLRRTAVPDLARTSKLRHPEHPVILSNRTSRPFCRRSRFSRCIVRDPETEQARGSVGFDGMTGPDGPFSTG